MKKILNWVLPAFLGIVPVLGMDETTKFLNNPKCIYSIAEVYEDGDDVKAIVDRTTETSNHSQMHVKAVFTHVRWKNDDEARISKDEGKVIVFSNGRNEKLYTKEAEHPYDIKEPTTTINLFAGNSVTNSNLPLGEAVDTFQQTVYERKDKTTYTDKGPITKAIAVALLDGKVITPINLFIDAPINVPLNVVKLKSPIDNLENIPVDDSSSVIYRIILKQKNVTSLFHRCYEHKDETCNQGFKVTKKFRHWWEYYEKTDLVTEVFKIIDGQETLLADLRKSEPVSIRATSRDSGRTNHPDCPGQVLPEGYKVISL